MESLAEDQKTEIPNGAKAIRLTKGLVALVDDDDYERINRYVWHASKQANKLYVKTRHTYMHRMVMNAKRGQMVDHINRNPMDNRKSNLRFCTLLENLRNQAPSKRNKSGYIGVHFCKQHRRWEASIYRNGTDIDLGRFDTVEEAAAARRAAVLKMDGEFAYNG